MKVKIKRSKEKKEFRPFSVKITFEDANEALVMLHKLQGTEEEEYPEKAYAARIPEDFNCDAEVFHSLYDELEEQGLID